MVSIEKFGQDVVEFYFFFEDSIPNSQGFEIQAQQRFQCL
jgi:hypothetical protein